MDETEMKTEVTETKKRTNDPAGLAIWRAVYPLLIFFGVDTVLETVALLRYFVVATLNGSLDFAMLVSEAATPAEAYLRTYQRIAELMTEWMAEEAQTILLIRCLILIPVFILFIVRDDKRSAKKGYPIRIGVWNKGALTPKRILMTVVLALTSFLGFNLLVTLIHVADIDPIYRVAEQMIYSDSLWFTILVTGIIAPILEELLLRGLFYRRLRNRFSFVGALVASSLTFGLIHGNLVQFIYASLMGAVLGYAYETSANLLIPILIHILANCGSCVLTALVEGGILPADWAVWAELLIMVVGIAYVAVYVLVFRKDLEKSA